MVSYNMSDLSPRNFFLVQNVAGAYHYTKVCS